MAIRLKLGSVVLDAAETGSTSTIAGARLLLPSGGLEVEDEPERSTFDVVVYFAGLASQAALKAAVDQLKAAVADARFQDIVFEYAVGSELRAFRVSDNSYQQVRGTVTSRLRRKTALCTVTVTAERTSPPGQAGGGSLPDGCRGALVNHQLTVSGLGACAVTWQFDSREKALDYLNVLRGGGQPFFLPAAFRLVDVQPAFEIQPGSGPLAETDLKPASLVAAFKELSENFAGNPAFADVKSCVPILHAEARSLQTNHPYTQGQAAGFTVTLNVQLEFKTEGNTGFDGGDTAQVAESLLRQKADDAVDVVKAAGETRLGAGLWLVMSRDVRVSLEHGTVNTTLVCVTGNPGRVLELSETVEVEFVNRDLKVYSSRPGAKPRLIPHPQGRQILVRQDLTIKALGGPRAVTKPAGVGSEYQELRRVVQTPKSDHTEGGQATYTTRATGEWEGDEALVRATPALPGPVLTQGGR